MESELDAAKITFSWRKAAGKQKKFFLWLVDVNATASLVALRFLDCHIVVDSTKKLH